MPNDKIKNLIGEIAVCVIAAAILLTVLIPTIAQSVKNGGEHKSRQTMSYIKDTLAEELNNKQNTENWEKLLNDKSSSKIIAELKKSMKADKAEKIADGEYFIKYEDGKLFICSAVYPEIDDISLSLPEGYSISSFSEKGEPISFLKVSGFRTYLQGESINPDKPEQMQFSDEDDLKNIFSDMTVTAINMGGGSTPVSRDKYTILTDGFDMSKPGTKALRVEYKNDNILNHTVYAEFSFYVMQKTECKPLVINFGKNGSYELAAWDWSDYVAEASQSDGSSKNFDASIVHFDDKYYYYPDGFNIDKRRDNSNPETSAANIDDPTAAAYRIEFKPNIIISSKEDENEMDKATDGALMLEEEQAYIWQSVPSKELDSGWIRVFCEMKKKEQ